MTTPSQLIVNIADLLEHPGGVKHVAFEEWVDGLRNDLVHIDPSDPMAFELALEAMDEGAILVRGHMSGHWNAECRRCLEDVRQDFRLDVAEVYRPPGPEVWEEGYVIAGETIDLHPMVRDNVLLALPMYPLCRDDCAGLCARCGGNRNRGECGCPPEDTDDRWTALKGLLREQP